MLRLIIFSLFNIQLIQSIELHAGTQLNEANYNSTIQKGLWFIEHFSPFCPHCQDFAPSWINLTKENNQSSYLNFGQIDCIAQGDLCIELKIDYYPQFRLYDDGKLIETYEKGYKDIPKLQNYLNEKLEDYQIRHSLTSIPPNSTALSASNFILSNHSSKTISFPNPNGQVISLNPRNWPNYTNPNTTNGPIFINFYVPWCPHCRKLSPVWKDVAQSLSKVINVADVDCSLLSNQPICKQEPISQFPTIFLYHQGARILYSGPRTLNSLDSFAQKAAATAGATDISLEKFEQLITQHELFFLFLYSNSTPHDDILAFQDATASLLGTALIYRSNSSELIHKFSLFNQSAQFLVFKDFNQEPWSTMPVESSLTRVARLHRVEMMKNIQDWINLNNLSLLSELSSLNYGQIFNTKTRGLVVLACFKAKSSGGDPTNLKLTELKNQIKVWARQWKKSQEARRVFMTVDWVSVDGDLWADWLDNRFGLRLPPSKEDPKESSGIIIFDPVNHLYYDSQVNGVPIKFKPSSVFQSLLGIEMKKARAKVSGTSAEQMSWRLHWTVFGTAKLVREHWLLLMMALIGSILGAFKALKMKRTRLMLKNSGCRSPSHSSKGGFGIGLMGFAPKAD
ncbi:hypothetical protein O181_020172 [Austropuccinia psidii MF-1]|uniref:Thioredoxin domain-containing protein n=1 Tax=Austropuccinia psidii MF-1 TaxID=1389203 RepID=A0A9Q3CB68_9BASI|nr:hypothetical protein [Austropuccinia psidii MF-1]